MPRLPDVESLGPRPTPQGGRPIAPYEAGYVGRALQGASAEIGEMVKKMELEDDNIAISSARRALNDWERSAIYDPEKGAASKSGRDAFGVGKELQESFDKTVEQIAKGLKGPRQQQLFTEIANSRRAQVLEWADKHVLREREVYQLGEFKANTASSIERASLKAAAAKTPEEMALAQGEIALMEDSIRGFYRSKGKSTAEADIEAAAAVSNAHAGVLRTLLTAGRAQEAEAYYKSNLKAIDEKDRAALATEINKRAVAVESVSAADRIWKAKGPQGMNEPVRSADLEGAAREEFAGRPELLSAVISGLHQREAAHNRQQSEVNNGNVNAVVGSYRNGANLAQVRSLPAYLALPQTKQREIDNMIEHDLQVARAKSEAEAARLTRIKMDKALPLFWHYSDPELLSKISPKEVEAMLPNLGVELTSKLLAMRKKMDDPVNLSEAKIDSDQFKAIADTAGLKPFSNSLTENEKRQLGSLKGLVEAEIEAEQKRLKRDMSREEKGKLMQQIVDNKVFLDVTMMPDREIIGALATPEQLKTAYVVVGSEEIRLSDIPTPVATRIINDLTKAGKPVSWRNVATGWALQGKPKQ